MRFEGTSEYVATDDLKVAVNAAVLLRRPLLVKGEPGTGKTVLAHQISKALDAPLIEWHVKSTTKAQQGLYEYDAVARLRDGQLGDERVHDISNYIKKGKLWEAFTAPKLPVLLIDEIDKADIEFPNDLLQELDRMSFDVYETRERIEAKERPIVVITSNNEKELPDAFLRRCFFHYIKFPDRETMQSIIDVHFPGIQKTLVSKAMDVFYEVREVPGLKKKPSTSELLDWLKLLLNEDMPLDVLQQKDPTKAQQGLYEYDAVARLRDGQLGDERVHDISNYIKKGKLWEAFVSPQLPVLLIDEIDKADIEFPNDLLQELDRMSFDVYETRETIAAAERPIVVITSNNEKELPDAFLRRCFFHYIKFPDRDTMQAIIDVHFPGIQKTLVSKAMDIFYEVRDVPGLKKKPSTSELLDWLKLLMNEDMPLDVLQQKDPTKAIPPLHGALLKNEQDVMLFEKLAFMARRQN